jgi:hypothetical protein
MTRRLAVREPLGAIRIEPQHPVPDRLQADPADEQVPEEADKPAQREPSDTKQAKVITMLKRPTGATVEQISRQPHTWLLRRRAQEAARDVGHLREEPEGPAGVPDRLLTTHELVYPDRTTQ